MSKMYLVNGKEVSSLKELAMELGVPKVTTRDIEAGMYPGVSVDGELTEPTEYIGSLEDDEDSTGEEELDEATEEEVAEVVSEAEDTEEELDEEPNEEEQQADPYAEVPLNTAPPIPSKGKPAVISDVTYPEKGTYTEKKPLQKFIKKLSIDELMEWADLEGILTGIKTTDHEAIWRMRVAMAIVELHFPKESTNKKSKSKYASYTTEQLVQMVMDNDLEVKDSKGDLRIMRMYCIIALRDAKLIV